MEHLKAKLNKNLGLEVEEYLISKGVNTPTLAEALLVDDHKKVEQIAKHVASIMDILGLDLTDDSLIDTPNRVAKMYVYETFKGLTPDNFPKATTVANKMHYTGMVLEKDIAVKSVCEHHLITIDGYATVAYIPKDKVLGLSKLNRIVNYFSRRPQIQERLTEQIYHALVYILGTDDVAVYINATHFCVKHRGIEDVNSSTSTAKLGGGFLNDPILRAEFYSMVNK